MMTFYQYLEWQRTALPDAMTVMSMTGIDPAVPNREDTRRAIDRAMRRGTAPTHTDLRASISPETLRTANLAVGPLIPRS
jgi:hypothetical protein